MRYDRTFRLLGTERSTSRAEPRGSSPTHAAQTWEIKTEFDSSPTSTEIVVQAGEAWPLLASRRINGANEIALRSRSPLLWIRRSDEQHYVVFDEKPMKFTFLRYTLSVEHWIQKLKILIIEIFVKISLESLESCTEIMVNTNWFEGFYLLFFSILLSIP